MKAGAFVTLTSTVTCEPTDNEAPPTAHWGFPTVMLDAKQASFQIPTLGVVGDGGAARTEGKTNVGIEPNTRIGITIQSQILTVKNENPELLSSWVSIKHGRALARLGYEPLGIPCESFMGRTTMELEVQPDFMPSM